MTFSDIVNLNYNFSYITETIFLPEMLTTYKNYLKEQLSVDGSVGKMLAAQA